LLHGQRIDHSAGIRVEAGIHAAIGIQPCNAIAQAGPDLGEKAADHNAPLRLHGDGEQLAIHIGGSELCIHAAVGIQPRNAIAGLPVDAAECAADQSLAIGLNGEHVNRAVRIRVIAGVGVLR